MSAARTLLCPLLIAAAPAHGGDAAMTAAGHIVTVQSAPACAKTAPPAAQLARYLRQYDPAGDPRLDIRDERPLTKKEVKAIKNGLVDYGLHYPGGKESVVTWL